MANTKHNGFLLVSITQLLQLLFLLTVLHVTKNFLVNCFLKIIYILKKKSLTLRQVEIINLISAAGKMEVKSIPGTGPKLLNFASEGGRRQDQVLWL